MRRGPMCRLKPAALAPLLLLLAAATAPGVRGQEAALPPAAESPAAASPDADGLLQLKASIAGSSNALANWAAPGDPCSTAVPWVGVNCTTNRVTSVTLTGLGLSGKLPATLALPELQTLALSGNQLDGTLPPQLASPALQRLLLDGNQLTGELPAAWSTGFPALRELALQGNRLEGTLPPAWMAAPGFATPFAAALQPGNPLLCGAFSPAEGHSVVFADGAARHTVSTTLGSCATPDGNCGSASINASAPNLYDLSWSNRVAALDLEAFNPSVQQGTAPSLGSPVQLPCYPSNPPTFFGGDAAFGKATWQSSTDGALGSWLPVSGNRQPSSAEQCSMTADAPSFWMVDLQRTTQVLAVLVRAGPQQMTGVDIRVGDDPSPTSGAICKAGDSFDPGVGKVIPCARVLKGRYVSISAATRVSLCVVEVYPLVSNAALGKRTTASGPSTDAAQGQVVNGRIDNQQCAQVMSGANLAAWITIDLGYEAAVETVVVVNGLSKFTNDLYIRLGNNVVVNGDENEVCSQPQTLPERGTLPIQCTRGNTAATGRFLTLYRQSNQPSSMYICQVLVYLAEGPREFIIPPPPPPSPPASPPPPPSPSSATINVQDSTRLMEVAVTVRGGSLVPFNPAVQRNVLLAANNTWLGNDGMTGVKLDGFEESGDSVAMRLRVGVTQPQAPAAANFIQTTVTAGTLDAAFRDEGLGNTTSTLQSVLSVDSNSPSISPAPSPPPSPSPDSSGSSVPIGAIVGGIVGGAVVLALVALLLMRRRRRAGYARRQAEGDGSESPKVGAMEAGRGADLLGFPKPGDVPSGYKVAVAAAGSSASAALQLDADSLTRGPPADIMSFLADDGGVAAAAGPHRDSPGSSRREERPSGELSKQRSLAPSSRLGSGVSELWTVDFRELDIQKEIGAGSFGKVYLAKWRETTVAVKVLGALGAGTSSLDDEFPDAAAAKTHPLYESLQKEAAMMASLRHPSIVMYLGVCLDPPAVVTEYCARGSLNDVLKRARSSPLLAAQLDWPRRLNMALDAAKGMLYLHSCAPPIIHRDLKSANLLVDKHWRVRVCDFNLSRAMEDNAVLSSMAATNPRWLAPEILSGKGYTFASDVYSFGICMWELLTWQVPYFADGPWQVVAMVTENAKRPEVPPREELPTGPFSGEGEYLALMRECWAQDPAQRPTFAAIISRLRRMLAAEASLRRDSPTKAARGRGSDVGLGLSGDDTPLARSRLASLSVPSPTPCVSRRWTRAPWATRPPWPRWRAAPARCLPPHTRGAAAPVAPASWRPLRAGTRTMQRRGMWRTQWQRGRPAHPAARSHRRQQAQQQQRRQRPGKQQYCRKLVSGLRAEPACPTLILFPPPSSLGFPPGFLVLFPFALTLTALTQRPRLAAGLLPSSADSSPFND